MLGRTLSHYEILQKVGEGGMGIVYKARDSRLGRLVAIKVLPADKVADPERRRRFIQEAKAASALNHPNIITIYDIGSDDALDFMVMEYVNGRTLRDAIPKHGMRLRDAVSCAIPVADALAKAHAAGIVHRDLKPGNILLGDDGVVKLLDFGLAKLVENTVAGELAATLPMDDDFPLTEAGAILGTVAYMSPEQAEGKPVDARSDIFSFGTTFYEMLTGQKPFQGSSRLATLSAILREDPKPLAELVPDLPPWVERFVGRCLRKDPGRRWQSMADLCATLQEFEEDSVSIVRKTETSRLAPLANRRTAWLASAAALAVIAVGLWRVSRTPEADETLHPIPLTSYPGSERNPSFSPDGDQIAFSWDGPKQDNYDIYVKRVGPDPPLQLTHDAAADDNPAWSPDGSTIAFLRHMARGSARVMLVPPLGGPERMVAEVADVSGNNQNVAWSPDGKWLAGFDHPPSQAAGIWLLSVETGERRKLTECPPNTIDINPAFSPDGLTLAFSRFEVAYDNTGDVYLLSMDVGLKPKGEPRRLTRDNRFALWKAWTPDGRELVYSAGSAINSLWRISASGDGKPRPITEQLGNGDFHLAMSGRSHRLVFNRQTRELDIYRVELSPNGTEAYGPTPIIASSRLDRFPRYSPDGAKIAFVSLRSGKWQLWICDGDGANTVQLTSMENGEVTMPRWDTDGRQIYFDSNEEGEYHLYVIGTAGGKPRKLDEAAGKAIASHVAPESPRLRSYSVRNGGNTKPGDLMFCPMPVGSCTKVQGVESPSDYGLSISPDGRWLLYTKFVSWGSDLMMVENFR